MNKNMKRMLLTIVSALLLVVVSVAGTLAYLTATTNQVTNTFTVGKVHFGDEEDLNDGLDEEEVDLYGVPTTEGGKRVTENEYKLIAGHTYLKDPTATIGEGSEPCYVRMFVSINNIADLTAMYGSEFWPHLFVSGWYNEIWEYQNYTAEGDTRIYEFWYVEDTGIVDALEADVKLPALFTHFTVPKEATNEQLKALEDLEIKVIAQAVQADTLTMEAAFSDAVIADPVFQAASTGGNTTEPVPGEGDTSDEGNTDENI